jgi:hypothetical protein
MTTAQPAAAPQTKRFQIEYRQPTCRTREVSLEHFAGDNALPVAAHLRVGESTPSRRLAGHIGYAWVTRIA